MIKFLIKEIRISQDITLKYLHLETKISISYLSEIENNKVMNPSFDKMVKIAKSLHVPMDDIYFDTNDLDKLKKALNFYVLSYGVNHPKTMEVSSLIDELIIKSYAKQKEKSSHMKLNSS